MLPTSRPRRLQGRMLIASAVASLILLSLFLWRSADPRIDSIGSPAGTKSTSSTDSSSSEALINVPDEYEEELYEDDDTLANAQQKGSSSGGIVHPFSILLPPASSSSSTTSSVSSSSTSSSTSRNETQTGKSVDPSPTPASKFPPPARPGNPVNWESQTQKPRVMGKPNNMTISGFVFYGRRDRVESMHCYLERNLVSNGGWLDNVIWVVNTKDEADLAYLDKILARSPLYKTHELPEPVWWPDYSKIWRMVDRETMYIKIDDDIVWFADDAIERLVVKKLERPDALAVSANIINNPPLSFLHYHMGAHHPYFPDIPSGFNLDTLIPPPEVEEVEETQEQEQKQEQEQIEEQLVTEYEIVTQFGDFESEGDEGELKREGGGTDEHGIARPLAKRLTKRFASFDRKTDWRPSAHPNWTGPDDFEWSLDYMPPPFQNHRWLRVPDDKALNRTPVAQLTYDVWGTTYESWAIATQQHYSLLENIETDQLDLYKFDKPWDMKGERIRINFMAILGSDVLDTDVFNWPDDQGDEDMIVLRLPHDLGRPILIEGTALAAHFNFMHQGGVTTTDLLARYKSLSAEKACLAPSPPAFE